MKVILTSATITETDGTIMPIDMDTQIHVIVTKDLSIRLDRLTKDEIDRKIKKKESPSTACTKNQHNIASAEQSSEFEGRITRSKKKLGLTSKQNQSRSMVNVSDEYRSNEKKIGGLKRKLNNIDKENDRNSEKTSAKRRKVEPYEIAELEYSIGEVIWAKIRGFPCWPAKIESIKSGKKQSYDIVWFNDYRRSNVFKTQIYKFYPNFERFSPTFSTHIGLETAAKEALIHLGSNRNAKH